MEPGEILTYIDNNISSKVTKITSGETACYEISSISMFREERDEDLPYENTARFILICGDQVLFRRLSIMNGLIYAREEYEINSLDELADFIAEVNNIIIEFEKRTKEYLEKIKLHRIKRDFDDVQ